FILKLNPMFYIVQGYRDAMISGVWFTQRWMISLYFWAITILMYLLGTGIFKKLKGQFADVL
ncbi:MAG: ABC transporter permease, partial [Clostridiales bacterium]|nr:ABC transporter permease [Clostridiales bacterium]